MPIFISMSICIDNHKFTLISSILCDTIWASFCFSLFPYLYLTFPTVRNSYPITLHLFTYFINPPRMYQSPISMVASSSKQMSSSAYPGAYTHTGPSLWLSSSSYSVSLIFHWAVYPYGYLHPYGCLFTLLWLWHPLLLPLPGEDTTLIPLRFSCLSCPTSSPFPQCGMPLHRMLSTILWQTVQSQILLAPC